MHIESRNTEKYYWKIFLWKPEIFGHCIQKPSFTLNVNTTGLGFSRRTHLWFNLYSTSSSPMDDSKDHHSLQLLGFKTSPSLRNTVRSDLILIKIMCTGMLDCMRYCFSSITHSGNTVTQFLVYLVLGEHIHLLHWSISFVYIRLSTFYHMEVSHY